MRSSISQALADDASRQSLGAHGVTDVQGNAVVVAEIEFREVAVQVIFGAVLIGAAHTAFED